MAADDEPYELVVAGPAARAIAEGLPEAVAGAVIDLITGYLLTEPQRVGKPLRRELEGIWSARRGTFRVLYRIDYARHEVVVLRVEHRRGVYRQRGQRVPHQAQKHLEAVGAQSAFVPGHPCARAVITTL